MVEGGGFLKKKAGRKSVGKKTSRSRRTPTHAVPTRLRLLLSLLLWRVKTNERSRVEDHGAPAAPLPLYLSLCSLLLSHPFPLSFIPPSVPSSPSTLLSSSPFHYLPPSLPLPSAFMLLLIIALTSLPPSLCLPDSLSPTAAGLHPCASAWMGPQGREGGDVPDGQTLNSRGGEERRGYKSEKTSKALN